MLPHYEKALTEVGALNINDLPNIITMTADAVPKVEITDKMRLTVAQSEIMLFAGMFKRNMSLWDGASIPVNGISMIIGASGTGKDRTAKTIRKCFEPSYELINNKREEIARNRAISLASEAGSDQPYAPDEWKPFYRAPESLFASSSSSVKGLHGHFNRLEDEGLGAGYITSLEIGSALTTSASITELIEFLSEVYDQGTKEVKLIGNKEEQLKPLHSMPVSALFGGSQANLLYDNTIRRKFKMEFESKLARRTYFNFNVITPGIPDFSTYDNPIYELTKFKAEANATAVYNRQLVSEGVLEVTKHQLKLANTPIKVDLEVQDLFNVYLEYNKIIAESIPRLYPMSILARQHSQWKALKLAGALAIFACRDTVTIQDYAKAINFTELMAPDLQAFEVELAKEPYEMFADYIKTQAIDNKAQMTIHQLRKQGYLTAQSSKAKLQELVTNASSYDKSGIYVCNDEGISYEAIVKTPVNGISYLEVSGTKEQRARQCASGFHYEEASFDKLSIILKGNYAYTPFEFTNGIRSKDNIIGGAKWIALDIDNSKLTASEMHVILQDINHHIALTSDPDNDFKYRLLIELDQYVTLEDQAWKVFTRSIAEDLHITIDNLPRSQIFFSYGAEEVFSVTDAEPLETRDHILVALNQATPKPKLTKAEATQALKHRMDTFSYAYECTSNGVKHMIAAAFEANSMGASKEEIIELLEDVNAYWVSPLPRSRMDNEVLTVVNRF